MRILLVNGAGFFCFMQEIINSCSLYFKENNEKSFGLIGSDLTRSLKNKSNENVDVIIARIYCLKLYRLMHKMPALLMGS